jgi:hypothetical protein
MCYTLRGSGLTHKYQSKVESLSGKNALAYLSSASVTKKKNYDEVMKKEVLY